MEIVRNYDDNELVEMINSNATLDMAIGYLYKVHFDLLSVYIKQNDGSQQDAEDIFQEAVVTFIGLVQQNKFRGESSIKTFLYAINKNMWLNELKRRNRAVVRETNFETGKGLTAKDASDYIAGREARQQVMAIMDKLGEICKKILLAFYYENLSMKDIVQTMDYDNEQVLRNKKHKCLKRLEQTLTADPILAKTLRSALQYEQ